MLWEEGPSAEGGPSLGGINRQALHTLEPLAVFSHEGDDRNRYVEDAAELQVTHGCQMPVPRAGWHSIQAIPMPRV